jgi:hypothetical protein
MTEELAQQKLTWSEWNSTEVPVAPDEKLVLDMICAGVKDINVRITRAKPLHSYLKLFHSADMSAHLFNQYFQHPAFAKHHAAAAKIHLKKADLIRLAKLDTLTAESGRDLGIYEFVLLHYFREMMKKPDCWMQHFYTLTRLLEAHVPDANQFLIFAIQDVCATLAPGVDLRYLVRHASDCIEHNKELMRYQDLTLYDHQKRLIHELQHADGPKLVLYNAPTGTGKTLTPLALAATHRVVYVCAARHVGLALARSAIAVGRKVAFAFGCGDSPNKIRLHYAAAKDYTVDRRTGGIRKVDNSQGQKVELMICDLASYLCAMRYMLEFNAPEDVIFYWDEPTIAMDHNTHPLHPLVADVWANNVLPRIVLASATLPSATELAPIVATFPGPVVDVVSYDWRKSIPIIDPKGRSVMPHSMHDVLEAVAAAEANLTLLRYMDLAEATHFVDQCEAIWPLHTLLITDCFASAACITMESVKRHYLAVVRHMAQSEVWPDVVRHMAAHLLPSRLGSGPNPGVLITTKDAYTLTSGPTIYLAEDLVKVANFLLQQAKIPEQVLARLRDNLDVNAKLSKEIQAVEQTLEAIDDAKSQSLGDDKAKSKAVTSGGPSAESIELLQAKATYLRQTLKTATLNKVYAPNSPAHLDEWLPPGCPRKDAFTSDVSDAIVASIMALADVDNIWKVLLLMGIGVFVDHTNKDYVEVMKTLADQQKLYLILANKKYVDGTNYQFSHGYVGKDMSLTRDKTLQALGRIGRGNVQHSYTARFRSEAAIAQLYRVADDTRLEPQKMRELFSSDYAHLHLR